MAPPVALEDGVSLRATVGAGLVTGAAAEPVVAGAGAAAMAGAAPVADRKSNV